MTAPFTGIRRYVHIYLPAGYDGVTPFPLWVELHGVFWATMGGVIKQVREIKKIVNTYYEVFEQQPSDMPELQD